MNDEQTRARFEGLMVPLMNEAYNLARWLMRNEADAQDVVQESYLKAFRFFAGFHSGANARGWLLRIVRNTCYSALGARHRQETVPELDVEQVEDAAPGPRANVDAKATAETVREAIAALPVDYREVVVLRELEGLSYKEISQVSGIPLGTVMSRLARARHQLYLMLKAREDSDRELHKGLVQIA
jgi:RNA polymerase sigma factor (sigma-70 family)